MQTLLVGTSLIHYTYIYIYIWLWVKTNGNYHFGVGAPPILIYFSGDWDVHCGYDLGFDPGHIFLTEVRHHRSVCEVSSL